MIVNAIFGSLALLSLALLLWQWLAARQFPLHRRRQDKVFAPAVTLLKSLKGADASTESCLRSWFTQEYGGEMQILFGVASADDPACEIVRALIKEYPSRNAQLIVCAASLGANAKASKLAELEALARHEVVVISDADVRVPADLLANAVAPLRPPKDHHEPGRDTLPRVQADPQVGPAPREREVGLVNCFYRLANPSTLAMQWEAIAINADFWSQVLQSQSLKPLDFALGAVIVTRRKQLVEIGGFKALADCLADDYQLGNRIARKGHRIALCPVVVECWDPPMTWRAVWKHQLRWARTIRVCQPVPYFFSILSNATLWPLLWWIASPTKSVFIFACAALVARILIAVDLQSRLTQSRACRLFFWIVPAKDLLQFLIWLLSFAGNRVEWRGRQLRLRRDGTLQQT